MRHVAGVLAIVCAALVGASAPAAGQGIFSKLGHKVKQRVDAKSDQAMDSALNRVANAVVCAVTDSRCLSDAKASGKPITVTDANGKRVSSADSAAAISAAVAAAAQAAEPVLDSAGGAGGVGGAGTPAATATAASPATNTVLVNYDFVPGDRVIYAEDFSHDNVGDFPKRMELVQGNFEVAKWNGAPFLRSTSYGRVMIPLPEVLPKQFTFEMDFECASGSSGGIQFVDPKNEPDGLSTIEFSPSGGGVDGPIKSETTLPDGAVRPVAHVAVMTDNLYVKAYVNGVRVANVPKATLGRSKGIWLTVQASANEPAYIGNIRVAEGGRRAR